ncbi:hypothetical protein BBP40_005889 [Aspergillus hancockii]|nr:hypothetical protein BBP40_005889 [Aspergillus hancockii]
MTSPSGYTSQDAHQPLITAGPETWSTQTPSNHSSPGIDPQQVFAQSSSTAKADILSRARSFLIGYGQFSGDQDFRPELLLNLASMMMELESQQPLKQEVQNLKAENFALQNENVTLKAYFAARLPTGEPMVNPPSTNTPILPRPPSDTSGKSWDRIVMDLI